MFLMMNIILMIFILINSMMMLINLISKKSFLDREKISPFECGFDPKHSARLPFSLQFFMISMIFLIFDIEITLLLPLIFMFKMSNLTNLLISSMIFIFILLIGLYHEWNQGSLNWK